MMQIAGCALLAAGIPFIGWGICFLPCVSYETYNKWRIATYVVILSEAMLAMVVLGIALIMNTLP
jgi:hypothetical protein